MVANISRLAIFALLVLCNSFALRQVFHVTGLLNNSEDSVSFIVKVKVTKSCHLYMCSEWSLRVLSILTFRRNLLFPCLLALVSLPILYKCNFISSLLAPLSLSGMKKLTLPKDF